MATNPYIRYNVKSEQDLFEDLVIESISVYGQDVYYLPRTIVEEDRILGDDIPSKFNNAYKIEMYIESIDGFGGEGNLFSKFGIEIRDQATFIVARRRWSETVASYNNNISGDLPEEGDLIYLPLSKSLFQIMHVEREVPFYQLSNLNVVRLECELFEYNDEALDTGVEEIDRVETLGYSLVLTLDSDGGITPPLGDIVTETLGDGSEITAEVVGWNASTNELVVAHVGKSDGTYGIFTGDSNTISSTETPGVWSVVSVEEDIGKLNHHNKTFDSDVDPFLVFDENNPFGDPSG